MRMSGLCKVEMSAFMVGRGPHGNGAHRLEPTRTGPIESVARGKAKASDAGSCSQAVESNRPPGAADAAPHSQRVKTVHVWRERRASFGELVMQDSSPFRWLEERGPACQLIALIDDATSRVWARFTEHDTTEENLRTFQGWLRRYGRPLAHYTDKNSIFRTARPAALPEQLRGEGARSQFGRALKEF